MLVIAGKTIATKVVAAAIAGTVAVGGSAIGVATYAANGGFSTPEAIEQTTETQATVTPVSTEPTTITETVVDPETGETVEVVKTVDATGAVTSVVAKDGSAVSASVAQAVTPTAPTAQPSIPSASAPSTPSAAPQAPAHTHSYTIPVYETQQVLVKKGQSIVRCVTCGTVFSNVDDAAEHQISFAEERLSQGITDMTGVGHSWSCESTADEYANKQVQTGTKCSCGAVQ